MTKTLNEVYDEAIEQRGYFVHRFSAIEFSISHLLVMALAHEAYASFGTLPFSMKKKLKMMRAVVSADGPMAVYKEPIDAVCTMIELIEDRRHFMVHALMIALIQNGVPTLHFKFYEHRDGKANTSVWNVSVEGFVDLLEHLAVVTKHVTDLVSEIEQELKILVQWPSPDEGL